MAIDFGEPGDDERTAARAAYLTQLMPGQLVLDQGVALRTLLARITELHPRIVFEAVTDIYREHGLGEAAIREICEGVPACR